MNSQNNKEINKQGLIIIVNYNQEKEIEEFLTELKGYWDINHAIVVDDASTDSSVSIAEALGFFVIKHNVNRGVGAAIRSGINWAKERGYDFIVVMSSNGKMRPLDLPKIVTPILEDVADYVTGSRFMAGGNCSRLPPMRKLVIPIFSFLCSLFLAKRFSDITCGFRAYKLKLFESPQVRIDQEWLDRYEMEYYIHYWACRNSLRIIEVPITIRYDHLEKGRETKIKPLYGWWSIVRTYLYLGIGIKR